MTQTTKHQVGNQNYEMDRTATGGFSIWRIKNDGTRGKQIRNSHKTEMECIRQAKEGEE